MQELTDDQLDGLFRKSTEESDTPYDPAAWEAMKDKLDDRDRATLWKKWLPWGLPLLLLLLMSGVWYVYQKDRPGGGKSVAERVAKRNTAPTLNPKQTPQTDAAQSADDESVVIKPEGAEASSTVAGSTPRVAAEKAASERTSPAVRADKPASALSINTGADATKDPVTSYRDKTNTENSNPVARVVATRSSRLVARNNRRSGSLGKKEKAVSTRSGNKPIALAKRDFFPASTSVYVVNSTGSLRKQRAKNGGEMIPFDGSNSTVNTPAATATEISENTPVTLPSLAELTIRPWQLMKLPGLANREITQPEKSEPLAMPQVTPVSSRGLSVRVAVAPDLSSIGLQNFSRPGTNVGVMLEYRQSPRWSVQAGVIRSTKVYKATSSQYDADAEYWVKFPAKPGGIIGQCNMLDIPVNVRYDIALRPRLDNRLQPSRWFISGGVTSYIMLKEDYTYENYPPHTYGAPSQWSTNSGGYGFSQLNLSAGYERAVSRRLSWQVEPFMKVPLKGVGFFKIDLLSTGAFLSLRYKL
ncbi:hypothetical protein [Spirosoma endbachense]|uniref:Outer membrane beta-barrel protein n=1 Tax=Spirosoma endbachense TaxID=2666025 RepID=A0A6P1W8R7_9BACT|nr:hypothetical protein [Spirosoma endbachense]QHW00773.1 hypothetical protein GJR95_39665 [Spirosoma endbachense]